MKITIISISLSASNPIMPGVERFVENLAIPLRRLGHHVKIISTYWNQGKRHDFFKGISVLRVLDSKALIGKFGTLFLLSYFTFGLNLLIKRNFKHFNNSDVIILPLAIGFSRFYKIKNIPVVSVFLHYDHPNSIKDYLVLPIYNYLLRRQFKIHKNIITISEISKYYIKKYYGISEDKIAVFPIGIDTYRFNPSNKSKDIRKKFGENILLYVGPFLKRKRIPLLIRSMPKIIQKIPDAQLILIGKGPFLESCKKLAISLKIQNNTKFLGFINEKELTKWYASSDIFIFPSELEGFGQVILEAMASGTPVICANKEPMKNIIGNGGITFKLNNLNDLSKKVVDLLNNHEKLVVLRKNSLNIVRDYEWLHIAKLYIDYFKKLRK